MHPFFQLLPLLCAPKDGAKAEVKKRMAARSMHSKKKNVALWVRSKKKDTTTYYCL